jgi:hypothetical protein
MRVTMILITYIVAFIAHSVPSHRMPIDYHSMFWISFPLVSLWALLVVFIARKYHLTAFWLLPSAFLALYWPINYAIHGLPACYHVGNCV